MLRKRRIALALVLAVLFMAGCQEKKPVRTDGTEVYVKKENQQQDTDTDTEKKKEGKEEVLFLITGIDTAGKSVSLRSCSDLKEKEYGYSGATYIKDKYGKDLTMEQLAAGEMVYAAVKKDRVTSIRVADEVFTYGDIYNFTLNQEDKSITVGNNRYYYEKDIMAFYKNSSISLAEISEKDTICLKGIDKKIYAVQVLKGHGTVVLENTELFEGGSITIGKVLSLQVEEKMRIEVPEGTHLLSVAKDGYGGSREIMVEANRETSVDLEELKGEGPKYGTIAFVIEPDSGTVSVNGEEVDLSQTLQLKYGTYTLTAKAEGYADWKGTLVVNSERGNIKIELLTQAEQEKKEEQEKKIKEESEEKEKSAKEKEEETKEFIDELRKETLSTSSGIGNSPANSSGTTSGNSGTNSSDNSSKIK